MEMYSGCLLESKLMNFIFFTLIFYFIKTDLQWVFSVYYESVLYTIYKAINFLQPLTISDGIINTVIDG
jgi:hypothetical protein